MKYGIGICKNPKCGRMANSGNYCVACLRAFEFGELSANKKMKEKIDMLLLLLKDAHTRLLNENR